MRKHVLILVAMWVLSLVAVGVVTAQVATQPVPPKVLSGADLGFEVTGIDHKDGAAVGRLVVKVNDKWVPAQFGGGAVVR
jgi:hypothetical protein